MPILSAEIDLSPADLLETSPPFCAETSEEMPQWWVFHTRARQEKSLARDLLAWEIPFYLPLVRRKLLIRGKPVQSRVPLFSSYVFVFGSPEARLQAYRTNRVAHVLAVSDGDQLRSDLLSVQRLISANSPLTVESRLTPGCRVRVRSGAMAGLEGTVIKRKGGCRLLVAVTMLQQGVSVDVDDYLLDPVN